MNVAAIVINNDNHHKDETENSHNDGNENNENSGG